MENFSEICTSAFFSAPIQENIEQSNSEFNQELSKFQVGRGIKRGITILMKIRLPRKQNLMKELLLPGSYIQRIVMV
ncbi:unnamed protein product [Colias eurytheme]|nr:unnamed protein product [Colias eurytheme]